MTERKNNKNEFAGLNLKDCKMGDSFAIVSYGYNLTYKVVEFVNGGPVWVLIKKEEVK